MQALRLIAAALVLFAAGPAWPEAPGERWDLKRFEAEALKRNRAITEANEEVLVNEARRMEAAWARFPTLSWTSIAAPIPTLQGDVLHTTTPTNQFVGFGGVWQQHKVDIFIPLFTFGKLRNAKRAAEHGVRAAKFNVDRAKAEVLRDVRRGYYAVKVAGKVLEIIQEGWSRLTDAEKKLEELLDKGSKEVEELDKNRLAVFIADVASRRQEAVVFDELSRHALRLVAGLPQDSQIDADTGKLEVVQVGVPPLELLVEKALRERPELKALGELVGVRKSLVALSESAYYPDFFAAGTVGVARCNVCTDQTNPFVYDPFNMDLYGGALGVRLTLDYPMKIARVRQAEAEHRKMLAQQERAIDGIRLEVRKAYLEWKQAKEQMAIIKKGAKSAQGWLIQSTISFNTGLIKLKDLTDALGAWFKFRLEELRSIYNYNVAVFTLAQVVGEELPLIGQGVR
jgi:outer membrane protein TolC